MEKNYDDQKVVWLKVTDYMHGWILKELGGDSMIREQRIACLQQLPGFRDIMRMCSEKDSPENQFVGDSISSARWGMIDLGLGIDDEMICRVYGVDKDVLKLFIPVECPKMRMTETGVLRPWESNVCFGRRQAAALQKLLRAAFWNAVADYNQIYARQFGFRHYAAKDMLESFCNDTDTPDFYVDAMRREWQRRVRRNDNNTSPLPIRREEVMRIVSLIS